MCGICAMCWICVGYVWWIRLKWICVGYVKCAGYVWDMCGVRYANNLLKNPATKRLSGKKKTKSNHTDKSVVEPQICGNFGILKMKFPRNPNIEEHPKTPSHGRHGQLSFRNFGKVRDVVVLQILEASIRVLMTGDMSTIFQTKDIACFIT